MRAARAAAALVALTAAPVVAQMAQPLPACFALTDVTRESGLVFRHRSGRSPTRHLPETMGAGVAWLDADGDGWLDVYLVQSGSFPPGASGDAADHLFRNRGDGTFEDISARAGIADQGYGQGVVAADVEGDGDTDLFVANVGSNTLWLNRGDGTFVDGTIAAGLSGVGWSSSAAFADADGDGDLDLYVARYVDYDPASPLFCGDFQNGRREYCDPSLFRGLPDRFYRNRGDGTFVDATAEAGLSGPASRGMGVVFTDLDGDRRPDIYVANDLDPNLLFHNLGGRFEDVSLLSGAAVSRDGKVQAGMGIGVGDLDGDGLPELSVTNFDVELNSLYRNLGDLLFDDISALSGFGPPSYNLVGFGTIFADLDRDGDLDAYVANGHVYEHPRWDTITYAQPPLLLAGDRTGHFRRCEPPAGAARVSRGLAAADYDDDGDVDLAVTDNDGPAQLLRNDGAGPWLGARLLGAAPNTGGVGAELSLGYQRRFLLAGDSYQSSSDPRALFGVPAGAGAHLAIVWPSGRRQRFVQPTIGSYLLIAEPVALEGRE